MSWAEVKKINSNLDVPLNVWNMLIDVHLYGSNSLALNDSSLRAELMANLKFMNDIMVGSLILEQTLSVGEPVGTLFDAIDGIGMNGFADSLSEIANSSEQLNAIANSKIAISVLLNSEIGLRTAIVSQPWIDAIFASETSTEVVLSNKKFVDAILESEEAMNCVYACPNAIYTLMATEYSRDVLMSSEEMLTNIFSSDSAIALMSENSEIVLALSSSEPWIYLVAKNYTSWDKIKPFIIAVNKDLDSVKAVRVSVRGSTRFTLKTTQQSYNANNMDYYCTTSYLGAGIITVASGYYNSSSTSDSVNTRVNGDLVSDGTLRTTYRPNGTNEDYITAVAVPVATFTENGSGYVAISCFTAS